jgi:hypothetical protein
MSVNSIAAWIHAAFVGCIILSAACPLVVSGVLALPLLLLVGIPAAFFTLPAIMVLGAPLLWLIGIDPVLVVCSSALSAVARAAFATMLAYTCTLAAAAAKLASWAPLPFCTETTQGVSLMAVQAAWRVALVLAPPSSPPFVCG